MKIGIIGAGKVVSWFLADLAFNKYRDKIKVIGIYSRTLPKAQKYAKQYQIPNIYNTLEEFLKGDFDLVYVGTTSGTHYQLVKKLLAHKFNVYCEKPLTLKYLEANELYQLAKKNQCLLVDGIKTGLAPAYKQMKKEITNGQIGDLIFIRTSYTKISTSLNVFNPQKDQDVPGYHFDGGVYPLFLVFDLGGPIINYQYLANTYKENKAISTHAFLMRHQQGAISTIIGSDQTSDNLATIIQGTKGYIVLGGNIEKYHLPYKKDGAHLPYTYQVFDLGHKLVKSVDLPINTEGEGLTLMLEHIFELWVKKAIESPIITRQISLAILMLLEKTAKGK